MYYYYYYYCYYHFASLEITLTNTDTVTAISDINAMAFLIIYRYNILMHSTPRGYSVNVWLVVLCAAGTRKPVPHTRPCSGTFCNPIPD